MIDRNNPKLVAIHQLNPIGQETAFRLEGGTARAEVQLNEHHLGVNGFVHRGILAFLMDEGMGWISRHGAGVISVTARLDVNCHQPVGIDRPLVITTCITKNTRRLIEISGRIESSDGSLIAEGQCLQFVMGENDKPLRSQE